LVKGAVTFLPLEGSSLRDISSMIYLKTLAALNARGGNGNPIDAADCVGERRLQGRPPRRPPRRHEMFSGNQLTSGGIAPRSDRRRQ